MKCNKWAKSVSALSIANIKLPHPDWIATGKVHGPYGIRKPSNKSLRLHSKQWQFKGKEDKKKLPSIIHIDAWASAHQKQLSAQILAAVCGHQAGSVAHATRSRALKQAQQGYEATGKKSQGDCQQVHLQHCNTPCKRLPTYESIWLSKPDADC